MKTTHMRGSLHLIVLLERELPLALIALFGQRPVRALARLLAHLRDLRRIKRKAFHRYTKSDETDNETHTWF